MEEEEEDICEDDEEDEPEDCGLKESERKKPEREEKTAKEMELEKAYWHAGETYGNYLRQKALHEVIASVCCDGKGEKKED